MKIKNNVKTIDISGNIKNVNNTLKKLRNTFGGNTKVSDLFKFLYNNNKLRAEVELNCKGIHIIPSF